MKVGYIYNKEEKDIKKDIENGQEVFIGIEVSSLLDTINTHEINTPGNSDIVLSLIKKECMILLGKVEETGVKENEKA